MNFLPSTTSPEALPLLFPFAAGAAALPAAETPVSGPNPAAGFAEIFATAEGEAAAGPGRCAVAAVAAASSAAMPVAAWSGLASAAVAAPIPPSGATTGPVSGAAATAPGFLGNGRTGDRSATPMPGSGGSNGNERPLRSTFSRALSPAAFARPDAAASGPDAEGGRNHDVRPSPETDERVPAPEKVAALAMAGGVTLPPEGIAAGRGPAGGMAEHDSDHATGSESAAEQPVGGLPPAGLRPELPFGPGGGRVPAAVTGQPDGGRQAVAPASPAGSGRAAPAANAAVSGARPSGIAGELPLPAAVPAPAERTDAAGLGSRSIRHAGSDTPIATPTAEVDQPAEGANLGNVAAPFAFPLAARRMVAAGSDVVRAPDRSAGGTFEPAAMPTSGAVRSPSDGSPALRLANLEIPAETPGYKTAADATAAAWAGIGREPATAGGVGRDAAAATSAETPAAGRREIFAASAFRAPDAARDIEAGENKAPLGARAERVKEAAPSVGTGVAKREAAMFSAVPNFPAHPVFEYTGELGAGESGAATVVASAAEPAGGAETSAPEAVRGAHQAVEIVLRRVDEIAARERSEVRLEFTVGDEALQVQVRLRDGEVQTTFRTDSPELRQALAQEWQNLTAGSDRPARLAAPVFAGSTADGAGTSAGEGGGYRQSRSDDRTGESVFLPAGAGMAPPAARSGRAPDRGAAAELPAGTAHRLNRFA